MKSKKINPWKVASIILAILIVGILVFQNTQKEVKFGDISIKEKDLQTIGKLAPYNPIVICDIEANKCIPLTRIPQ